jgi:hypothetical protein
MAKNVKAANQTRAQKAKALHEKKTKERLGDAKAVKALYISEKDSPLIEDILKKANGFIKYHVKIAQDGVGARKTGHLLTNNQPEVENYFLSNDEVAGEMKKAAGLQELVDYIERQIRVPEPEVKVQKPKPTA